jgi:hypothetical protein
MSKLDRTRRVYIFDLLNTKKCRYIKSEFRYQTHASFNCRTKYKALKIALQLYHTDLQVNLSLCLIKHHAMRM